MSETDVGNLVIVPPSMPPLTSISCAHVNRVSDYLTSSVSPAQYTPQGNNNLTENRLQIMERNSSSIGETLNRLIGA